MDDPLTNARRDLETIRSLMERSRYYRHLPPLAPLLAGGLALAGAYVTHLHSVEGSVRGSVGTLGLIWGAIFILSLAAQLGLSYLAARREGGSIWSPLAAEIIHALWPPFLVAGALTAVLVQQDLPDLVAPLWILCYGIGGVAAGAYAHPAVRGLGVGFLIAGLIDLGHPVPAAIALGATFGVFHLILGAVLFLRPAKG